MELVKNIFFNTDKLTQDSTVKISYTGKFFQENSEKVFLHYGFGLLWENLAEVEMEKTEIGFQTEINLLNADTFNFCLKNENNEWDNNSGANYIFPLEKIETDLVIVPQQETSISTHKRLRRSYIWSKKIRIAVYKLITYLPKIISGNYKRKLKTTDA